MSSLHLVAGGGAGGGACGGGSIRGNPYDPNNRVVIPDDVLSCLNRIYEYLFVKLDSDRAILSQYGTEILPKNSIQEYLGFDIDGELSAPQLLSFFQLHPIGINIKLYLINHRGIVTSTIVDDSVPSDRIIICFQCCGKRSYYYAPHELLETVDLSDDLFQI